MLRELGVEVLNAASSVPPGRRPAAIASAPAMKHDETSLASRSFEGGAPLLVVVFSDHGEGFNEHGARYPFYDVHEETIRVALLVRGPGVAPGDRPGLTALLELFATVLQIAHQPIAAGTPSRSLEPVLLGRPSPMRPSFPRSFALI